LTMMRDANSSRPVRNCRLHPLIHTIASRNSAQNLVAWSQRVKCGLKYVTLALSIGGKQLSAECVKILTHNKPLRFKKREMRV